MIAKPGQTLLRQGMDGFVPALIANRLNPALEKCNYTQVSGAEVENLIQPHRLSCTTLSPPATAVRVAVVVMGQELYPLGTKIINVLCQSESLIRQSSHSDTRDIRRP